MAGGERRSAGRTALARLAAALLVAALSALGGCTRGLTGLHDVEMQFEAAEPPAEPPDGVASRIRRRLEAHRIVADVSVTPDGRATLVVDEELADRAESLVTWPGGLRLCRESDAPPGADPAELAKVRSATGTWRELRAALPGYQQAVGPGGRVLLERVRRGHWRTRIVGAEACLDLTEAIAQARVSDDGSLRVGMTGPSRVVLSQHLSDESHAGTVVVVRGDESLGVHVAAGTSDADALIVRLAEGPESHLLARTTARLLGTGSLPEYAATARVMRPPRWGLAALNLVLPFALAWTFLWFVRRFDRAHPEPLGLTTAAFVLGGLSTIPTLWAEMGLSRIPWLDPELASRGGQIDAFPATLLAFTVTVGLVEETFKFAAARLITLRREFDEPIDGIVYGVAASLGFAAVENVSYLAAGRVSLDALTGRTFVAMPMHLFLGAVWGYALGRRIVQPAHRVWPWLLAAAFAHGLYDAAVSTESLGPAGLLVSIALAVAFTLFLRGHLRHGKLGPGRMAEPVGSVRTMRLGSPLRFWTCAIVMYVAALFLTAWGASLQGTRLTEPGPSWVAGLLALLIVPLAAYGATAFLPLDATLDDAGLSFAGSFRRWSGVTHVEEAGVEGDAARFAWLALVALVSLAMLCIMPLVVIVRLVIAGVASAQGARPADRTTADWLLGTPHWVLVRSLDGDLLVGPVDGQEGEVLRSLVRDRLAARDRAAAQAAAAGAPGHLDNPPAQDQDDA